MSTVVAGEKARPAGAGRRAGAWVAVAAAMSACAWGGNQFTPLLVVYRSLAGYPSTVTDALLGTYVLGLVPGLLIGGPLSDRYGRKPLMIGGTALSLVASGVLALGPLGVVPLGVGRLLTGAAVGVAMAVGTSWVKELSLPSLDPGADAGTGARRAALALTFGFGIGAGVAGALAQWAPWPRVVPYVAHIVGCLPVLGLLVRRGVETRVDVGRRRLVERLRVPTVAHRRFRWVVLPMAPWIFASAGVAYAVIPDLNARHLGHDDLLYATLLTVCTLGAGVLVQPLGRRLDSASTARAVVVSMVLMAAGMAVAAVEADVRSPGFGLAAAVLLGMAYGIAIVSGLLEVQRIAAPDELAGLTGVYYALAYVGFLLPATLAGASAWLPYDALLGIVALVALACTAITASAWSRHLPATAHDATPGMNRSISAPVPDRARRGAGRC